AHRRVGVDLEPRRAFAEFEKEARTERRGTSRSRRLREVCAGQGIRPDSQQGPIDPQQWRKEIPIGWGGRGHQDCSELAWPQIRGNDAPLSAASAGIASLPLLTYCR